MMKLRLSLRNSVRAGLNRLVLIGFLLLCGCSSSTEPTFYRENIAQGIQDVCKKEYNLGIKAKLFGKTLWVYVPLENIFTKKEKPEKFPQRFEIKEASCDLKDETLMLGYSIVPVPEKELAQDYGYDKKALEKINNVWKALRRVLFSMEREHESEPEFCVIVIADIKNGLVTSETFYYPDLKKVSYGFISWDEYQHRTLTESYLMPEAIDNLEGSFLNYKEITLREFITGQIAQRIKLKFQRPEVEKSADIDKEVRKVAEHTLRTYNFRDFSALEMYNLMSNNKVMLRRAQIFRGAKKERF